MKKSILFVPLISVIILTFASCRQKYFSTDGNTWGTTYHIVYSSDRNLDTCIEAELRRIDSELSMFNQSSTVSKINSGLTDSVSADFKEVFDLATFICNVSGGYYDPTIAPLTDLWGFGRKDVDTLPDESSISAALLNVGITDCSISPDNRLTKKTESTSFDFSSIAKGYGVECVGRMLETYGCKDYLVEIGGEILARGYNPKGKPWRIQIDAPVEGSGHTRLSVIELGPERRAIATSGNYRRYRSDDEGRHIGHTLSPITGYPVVSDIISATIFTNNCATADALATACMAMGDTVAVKQMLAETGVQGIIVTSDNKIYSY